MQWIRGVEKAVVMLTIALGAGVSALSESSQAQEAPFAAPRAAPIAGSSEPARPSTAMRAANEDFKREIEVWRERIRKRVETLSKLPDPSGLGKLPERKLAVQEMIELVDDLSDEAKAILDVAEGLNTDLAIYRQSLLRAPPMFAQWSERFEQKAGEVKSAELREAYADYAGMARSMGQGYAQQAVDLEKQEGEIHRRVEFVKEAKVMLGDVRELLQSIPSQGGEETARLLQRIETYADAFRQSIQAMRGVADKCANPNAVPPRAGIGRPLVQPGYQQGAGVTPNPLLERLALLRK